MKHRTTTFGWVILLLPNLCWAQIANPLSFFPHHEGDIWEYYDPFSPTVLFRNVIERDSLGSDGKYYLRTTLFDNMIIDTLNFFVYRTSNRADTLGYHELRYRLDADSGDTWVAQQTAIAWKIARVARTYYAFVFSKTVLVKQIDFYGRRFDNTDSLLTETDYLASEFGLIGQDNDAFPVRDIKGTLINGEMHGILSSVDQGRDGIPETFSLLQNYPNPFNPSTTITYQLDHKTKVELRIFDVIGRQVRILVDANQDAGRYETRFDAKQLSSGVYYCVLKTTTGVQNKKMLLLR